MSLFTVCALQADTIELADGTLLEGDFIGSSNGIINNTNGPPNDAPDISSMAVLAAVYSGTTNASRGYRSGRLE
ncbi:MAG: hypothetical protein ACERLB_16905 [Gammaproteobacteria bacterium]